MKERKKEVFNISQPSLVPGSVFVQQDYNCLANQHQGRERKLLAEVLQSRDGGARDEHAPRSVCICVMCMEHLYDKSRVQLNDESSTQMLIDMEKTVGLLVQGCAKIF